MNKKIVFIIIFILSVLSFDSIINLSYNNLNLLKFIILTIISFNFISVFSINKIRYINSHKAYFKKHEKILLLVFLLFTLIFYNNNLFRYYDLILSIAFYMHCRILMNKIITEHIKGNKSFFLNKSYQILGALSVGLYIITFILIYKFFMDNRLNILYFYIIGLYLIITTPVINKETINFSFAVELSDDLKNKRYIKKENKNDDIK